MTRETPQDATTPVTPDSGDDAVEQQDHDLALPEDSDFEGSDEGVLNASSSRISLEKSDRSLWEFRRWHDDNELVLDPEWQRNYVWSNPQASTRLIHEVQA